MEKQNQHKSQIREEENPHILPNRGKNDDDDDDELSDSFKGRKKYKDVADAAQAAFESAANAAAAARAAVELSRFQSHDPDDHNSSSPQPRKVLDGHDSVKAIVLTENKGEKFNKNEEELENPKDICGSNSAEEVLKGATVSVDAEIEADPFVKEQVSYESENKSDDEKKSIQSPKQSESGGVLNEVLGSKVQSSPFEDLEKRPFSVRTRRLHGY